MTEDSTGTIGRYEIEREIGRGGMAVVYKARDPRLDRWVAIKLIQAKAFAANIFGHIRERFEREAKALARLDHPNIVKVLDYGEHEGAPYLVMDYLEGATLKEVRKPLRVETAVRLLRPIAEALDYVHRHGLLHRDIKPSNIMITKEEQRVILTDFGIAKWIEEESELQTLTGTGVGIGTPEYMSPEQGRGKKVDERSDMYSLAIVFYELITGKKPYTGDTPLDVLMNQVSVPIPDPRSVVPEINESVKRFLDRAMAKKPDDRYATMKDFLRDFDGLRLQSLAEPAKTGQTQTGIQTVAKADSATDSSIRFGRTDFRKIETAAQEASAKREPQAGIQRPRASRRYGRSIALAGGLAVLALIAGISALRSRNRQQLPTTAAVDAALAAIERSLAETQRALPLAQTQAAQTLDAGRIAQEATLEATIAGITTTAESALRSTAVSETQRAVISAQETLAAAAATATAASLNPFAGVSAGDTIEFGRYEQDNDLSNGAEAIEWLVLDVSDGSALVTSRYGLDAKAYNEEWISVTWETSTIRAWLNGEFYASAFAEAERRLIALSDIENADNPEYGTDGGNDTRDRVFLLSLDEAERYFADDDVRRLKATDYAVARGVWVNSDNGNAWWWLRSPGSDGKNAAEVRSIGSIYSNGNDVFLNVSAVRPALRIRLDSNSAKPENPPLIPISEATAEINNPYANVKVGDTIAFGRYEQDNDLSNGAEAIEWLVLDVSDGSALVTSRYGLGAKAYNEEWASVTWETSTIRAWLNGEFYASAFMEQERRLIELSEVKNADNLEYGTNGGNDTQDRVFLLSLDEAERYFADDDARRLKPTDYAVARDVWVNSDNGNAWWWLRSPGDSGRYAAGVSSLGSLALHGDVVSLVGNAVRPALRIRLDSNSAETGTPPSITSISDAADNPYAGVKVGDTVEFGRYEQDNNLSNGAEAIEWLVLDVSDGSALVTSRYGLDAKAYNEKYASVSWETSTIRTWLNGEFYESAFAEQERRLIELSEVKNADNPEYGTNGGNDTQDRVFLLSLDEAERYFADDDARRLKSTDYAVARDVWVNSDNGNAWWWLRSPGDFRWSAAEVTSDGVIITFGDLVGNFEFAVRPALRIRLDSNITEPENPPSIPISEATAEINNPYAGVSVGDTIAFGRYEQDNDLSNGAEAIEWLVLDVSDGSALVTSRYGLDMKAYNEEWISVTWETSTIRAWLNGEFYESAFAEEERRLIELSEVKNADNPEYGTNGGNDTQDRVFLLSLDEAERYFADGDARRLEPTDYAVARGVWEHSGNGNAWWWLRSPGSNDGRAAEVSSYGTIINYGNYVNTYANAVRPALRIKIGN